MVCLYDTLTTDSAPHRPNRITTTTDPTTTIFYTRAGKKETRARALDIYTIGKKR
jgi:hypothetical protein